MTKRTRSAAGAVLVIGLVLSAAVIWYRLVAGRTAPGAWPGVDESVIGQFAQAAGRPEPAFAIDWLEGDSLLFAFLCAGLVAGFVLGYYARIVLVEQRARPGSGEAP